MFGCNPQEIGGVAMPSGSAAGLPVLDGSIVDLQLVSGGAVSILAAFRHSSDHDADLHQFVAMLDGEMLGVSAQSPFAIGPVGDGDHSLRMYHFRSGEEPPNFQGDACGNRVFLRWTRSEATDAVAYRVYWDAGTGTVDTATALAEVTLLESQDVRDAAPGSGTGTGRVEITGLLATGINGGPQRGGNGEWSLEIGAAGAWTLTAADGTEITGVVVEGVQQGLLSGLSVVWLDPAASYDVGDAWTFFVGPRNWFITGALETGNYKFQVSVLDGAGNESTLSTVRVVAIVAPPPPLTGVTLTKASSTTVTVAWDEAAINTNFARVYTNWDVQAADWSDHIIEEWRQAETELLNDDITLTVGDDGIFRCYVRVFDYATGLEEDNVVIHELDMRATVPSGISAPVIVNARAGAGGVPIVTWEQDTRDGVPEDLHFYVSATADWGDAVLEETVAFGGDASVVRGGFIVSGNWTGGVESGNIYIGIIAEDSDGGLTEQGALFGPITMDGTAPDPVSIDASGTV